MKRVLLILVSIVFLVMLCMSVKGIHRKTKIYTFDYVCNVETVNDDKETEEENSFNNPDLIIPVKSEALKDEFEKNGYKTTVPEGADFYQSESEKDGVTVSYGMNDEVRNIEIRYTYDKVEDIKDGKVGGLMKAWKIINKCALNDDSNLNDEFLDFVKGYEELDGESAEIGGLSMYSQVYGKEFIIDMNKASE